MGDRITYIGLDVHKDGIVVALAEGGLRGAVREYSRIARIEILQRVVMEQTRQSAAKGLQAQWLTKEQCEQECAGPSAKPNQAGHEKAPAISPDV